MAKTSSIEKNNRRRRLTKKFAGKRSRLKAIAQRQEQAARGALRGLPQAGGAAAQWLGDAHPQSLRGHRPRAGRITAS